MPRTFEFTKNKTALVIVDLQNDFVRPGAPMVVNEALATIPANQKLITFARENGIPVIFTKFVSGKTPSLLWNWSPEIPAQQSCSRNHERYYADIDKTEQCADVIDELKPIMPEDYVIEKYHYSSFHNTSLVDILRSEGADTIIVTGTVTHLCVYDTIRGGFEEGFKVILASDCASTWDLLQQKAVEENTAHKYGMVMTSDELIQRLQ
ncbi:MAG: cysteine hydrolase [Defluviitaleaceae bacterium]|nr:cysteine hydrolase [Defluviitaleaceae bacterium]